MIVSRIFNEQAPAVPAAARTEPGRPELFNFMRSTHTKKIVSAETAKTIATAYRCGNIISDDIAGMPLQQFNRFRNQVRRLYPDAVTRNTAYLIEKSPNRWMTPFIFKKTVINWLLFWGNAYIWKPVSNWPELFILPANQTFPVMDESGNKWYTTRFPNGQTETLPDAEMVHLMINSADGLVGQSVLTYARETLGRQMGSHETQDKIFGGGLLPTALLWLNQTKEISQEARELARKSFLESAGNGVAVFDSRVAKFETITLTPADAQFLEGVQLTDTELANFFGIPLFKLNMGKQSYESNEQQDLDYLKSTLNPFLLQWEQAAGLKWIDARDQAFQYLRFNRDAILQTDAKTRTEVLVKRIQAGIYTPNDALAIEDLNGYLGGDSHYMQQSYGRIREDGSIESSPGLKSGASENRSGEESQA